LRTNGEGSIKSGFKSGILAVGDSFTFGDEVHDEFSWPAQLEKILKIKVWNGGVFGYGVDQSYLRLIQLLKFITPEVVIFSFFPDDILRCENKIYSSAPKPYFTLEDGNLILNRSHIHSVAKPPELDLFRKVTGYSYFFHKMMMKINPELWISGLYQRIPVHSQGIEVTRHLFVKLESLKKYGVKKVILMAQYGSDPQTKEYEMVDQVLDGMGSDFIRVVDPRDDLERMRHGKTERASYKRLFRHGHMSELGNEYVAKLLFSELKDFPFINSK
jgi:hypothetical protein